MTAFFIWTVLIFLAVLLGLMFLVGWAWYWALLVAWLVTGAAASFMEVR